MAWQTDRGARHNAHFANPPGRASGCACRAVANSATLRNAALCEYRGTAAISPGVAVLVDWLGCR